MPKKDCRVSIGRASVVIALSGTTVDATRFLEIIDRRARIICIVGS